MEARQSSALEMVMEHRTSTSSRDQEGRICVMKVAPTVVELQDDEERSGLGDERMVLG